MNEEFSLPLNGREIGPIQLMYDTIIIEGQDRCGKDTLVKYINRLDRAYIVEPRGLVSNVAYNKLYKRNISYNVTSHINEIYVLLTIDEDDWGIRCNLTKEDVVRDQYREHSEVFKDTIEHLKSEGIIHRDLVLEINMSHTTTIDAAKQILRFANTLNGIKNEKK